MTPIQTDLLVEWDAAKKAAIEAKKVVDAEMEVRKRVMASFFPKPTEGVNTLDLSGGWKLKGTYKLKYKLEEAMIELVSDNLRKYGENPDLLIDRKPTLKLSQYRELVKRNVMAAKTFSQALTITEESPTIELVPPKEKK